MCPHQATTFPIAYLWLLHSTAPRTAERDSFLSYTRCLTAEKEQSTRDARAAADDARLARDEVEATRQTLALERERVKLIQ